MVALQSRRFYIGADVRKRLVRSRRLMFEALERRSLLSVSGVFDSLAADLAIVNQRITTDSNVQQMPSIAVDPLDNNHLVLAYMDYSLVQTGYAGIGVAVSHDGGDTWQDSSSIPLPSFGYKQKPADGAADPIVRFDDQGHVFVSFMAVTYLGDQPSLTNPNFEDRAFGIQSHNGIFVARSDEGGSTWNAPTAVVSHTYVDHDVVFDIIPDLAIDTFRTLPNGQDNPNYGNMYVTWTRIYPAGQFPGHPEYEGGTDIMIAVSRDGGQSWETQVQDQEGNFVSVIQDPLNADGGEPGRGAVAQSQLAIGPDGKIYLAEFGGGDFAINVSSDGGESFLPPDHATGHQLAFGPGNLTWVNEDGLPTNQFRTWSVRAIAADPTNPQQVYAVDVMHVTDKLGKPIDAADVFFAGSSTSADTWQSAKVLNDDNGGQSATGSSEEEVIAGQAMPRLVVDAQGNIGVIWYDTRRDPANHKLDVYGTVSTNGGQTFSPNFRITDISFDADKGSFIDAVGDNDYYLGDYLGLAMANNTAYAAWTDTRNDNQDIYFAKYSIQPAVSPPNDRYESNDTPAEATDLGRVVQRIVPKLAIAPGDEDWFRVEAAATGDLVASAMLDTQTASSDGLLIEIWDETGTTLLASGENVLNESQIVIGQEVRLPGQAGQSYLVRVLGANNSENISYCLHLQSLTADLGTQVFCQVDGSIESGGAALYRVTTAAAGSLNVQFTEGANVQGNLNFQILDAETLAVITSTTEAIGPGTTENATLPVQQGQSVLLLVSGDGTSSGDFSLQLTNFDQYSTSDSASLFVPDGQGASSVAMHDLNGDNKPDLLVANTLSNTISVYLGNGDGTFQSPRQSEIGAFATSIRGLLLQGLPSYGRAVSIAYLNADTIPDVVVTNYSSADVSVLLGRGDGTFVSQRRFDATTSPIALAVGDLNNDQTPDLVVIDSPLGSQITVAALLGRGNGTFKPQQTLSLQSIGAYPPGDVVIADFNKDGNADLAVSGRNKPGVVILLGNGDGTFRDGGTMR